MNTSPEWQSNIDVYDKLTLAFNDKYKMKIAVFVVFTMTVFMSQTFTLLLLERLVYHFMIVNLTKIIIQATANMGVGGSNPLVPTKIPLKTSLSGLFFYGSISYGKLWGETGE